jgi:putative ABC transport system permease protein
MKLSPLDRKLFRELWRVRGQAVAIALVIGAGVALYVLLHSTIDSLSVTQQTYYDRYRFADVFASLRRAPIRLEPQISEIPGVAHAETRVVADVTIDIEGFSDPAVGRLIGIPEVRRPILNDLFVRKGRWIEPGKPDEVMVAENFAYAHELGIGDKLAAVINGRRRELEIVGLALTPEYIYSVRPGEILPDDARFGVMWMNRRALAAAFDMEGGFNDVVLTLMRGASEEDVIDRLDDLLAPYGGMGAIPRKLQPSHFYLTNELAGLQAMGESIPIIFLMVAAFLLNVVLSRMIAVQREEIAVLKAVGYSNAAVAGHYIKWAILITAFGTVFGIGIGAWLGRGMTQMYTDFFDFPILLYRLSLPTAVQSALIGLAAAFLGTLVAVRRVVSLPPAEAMRPEPPAAYSVSLLEKMGLKRLLSQPTRIIFRNLQRSPTRALVSIVGIAAGCGLLIFGTFSMDSMDEMVDLEFYQRNRYDLMVNFVEPASAGAYFELQGKPGVIDLEPFRAVPVRLRLGPRSRYLALIGLVQEPRLNRLLDISGSDVPVPPEGLAISRKLAEILGASLGDMMTVEVLEGNRPVREAMVSRLVDDLIGVNAYMDIDALHRLLREGGSLSGAYLRVDESMQESLNADLKRTPKVAGVMLRRAALQSFEETLAEMFGMVRWISTVFAAIIAFGVVYNGARISLSERGRELASLRVLGFTRAEISYILLGELAIVTALAIPLGMVFGYGLAWSMVQSMNTEVWRMPLIISRRTYVFAVVAIIVATLISGLIVRRRLDRLDLIEVLKTRE